MQRWSHSHSSRLTRRSPSPPLNMADIDVDNFSEDEDNQTVQNLHEQPRTLRDFMHPIRIGTPSHINFPPNTSCFNFKPGIIQLLPVFHDFESKKSILAFERI